MPSDSTKILEFSQYQKPDRAPFVIYADFECLIEKIDGCKNNTENPPQQKYIPSGFSMSTISSFKSIENKHDVYRGKNCMKTFCKSLREHAMEIITLKKIKLLTNEQRKSYQNTKICYICKEIFDDKHAKVKKYYNVRGHCYYTFKYKAAAHIICNLKYSVSKKVPIIFHN